ncbi:MAG: hypothetical protein H6981_06215 [Gammaproteobacteria bacterium]|nr:hypothetical protein [Gammaproteobacteria bacterium]MCP5136378.1 hypothetical protein [Gammaproteobacteria bacterium]
MLEPIEFLEEELRNVEQSLKETLRYEYGHSISAQFYEECDLRLTALRDQFNQTIRASASPNRKYILGALTELHRLSILITRIERSHLGEFSWAFASALQNISAGPCTEQSRHSDNPEPLFFISAEGGISSYGLHPEQRLYTAQKRQIFNIVFPRTLRNHVLFHPILAHEIGHAAMSVSRNAKELEVNVLNVLIENSVIADDDAIENWLDRENQSASERDRQTIRRGWAEEFFCDLFGLMLIGPSFISAHLTLLDAIDDPDEQDFVSTHPPSAARYLLVAEAASNLGWSFDSSPCLSAWFKQHNEKCASVAAKFKFFDTEKIREAISNLRDFLSRYPNSLFPEKELERVGTLIQQLNFGAPPNDEIRFNNEGKLVPSEDVDFRTILFAGWVAWNVGLTYQDYEFSDLNRLCSLAIIQNTALREWKSHT